MYSLWIRFVPIFVFIFGLSACIPDKPQKRQDDWQFAPPEFLLPSIDGERERLKLGEASQKDFPAETELLFPSVTDQTSPIVLEIISMCRNGKNTAEESFQILAPASLQLGSIVPGTILVHANETSNQTECSFEFVAINQHRSTHHFLIPAVKLSNLRNYGNLVVTEKLKTISPVSESQVEVKVSDLNQLKVEVGLENGIAEFICADFRSSVLFTSLHPIDWLQLAYKQSSETLENVAKKIKQACRLAIKENSGRRIALSTPITLHFPPPPIEVQTTAQPMRSDWETYKLELLNVSIVNPSTVDQYFALPEDGVMTANTFVVWRGRGADFGYYSQGPRYSTSTLTVNIEGSNTKFVANKKTYFKVAANSTVKLSILANGYYLHQQTIGYLGLGFYFVLQKPFRLERIQVDSEFDQTLQVGNVQLVNEFSLFKTLDHHLSENKIYVPHHKVNEPWSEIVSSLKEAHPPSRGD